MAFSPGAESPVEQTKSQLNILLEVLLPKDSPESAAVQRTQETLLAFVCSSSEKRQELYFKSSDLHSIASLLVQALLAKFSEQFLTTKPKSLEEGSTLRSFLTQDYSILLLLSIHITNQQVDSTYLELAELLLVVLKTLLAKSCDFTIDKDSLLGLLPFFNLVSSEQFSMLYSFTGPTFLSPPTHKGSHTHNRRHSSESPPQVCAKQPISSEDEISKIIEIVKQTKQNFRESISERMIYSLILSVFEGVAIKGSSRGTTQVSSTIHLLQGVTSLFEDLVSLWLQDCNKERHTEGYTSTIQVARTVLRYWLVLSSQVLHSPLSTQQINELKPLLTTPLACVSKACFNLQLAGLFKGNEILDQEFTIVILESIFSSLFTANVCAVVTVCSVDDFFEVLRDTLSDGVHEWFTYLCSKLHAVVESISPSLLREDQESPLPAQLSSDHHPSWAPVLNYSFQTLAHIIKQLIAISSHIQSCQRASKLALTSTFEGSNNRLVVPFLKPVIYSLEVATGFDKLTQRLSKIAQLLLDLFRTVPLLQLLSLQLLSETAKDNVGTIGNFLASISDLSVRSNAEVLDLYLELLENVWFKLPADYQLPASSPWWNKLSNYSVLLMESNQEVVCQVIYHLQCLFGHESSVLKARLTQYIIIPFHQHLTALIKEKCYQTKSGEGSPKDVLNMDLSLESREIVTITLFLKLLAKVMTSSHCLGKFASDSFNLYSLFLYLPLSQFRTPALAVLEECLVTLKANCVTSPAKERATTPESDQTGIQKTIVQILLNIAFAVQLEKIPNQCLSIAEGRGSLQVYGIRETDQIEQLVKQTFETKPIKDLLVPSFVNHLAVVADVWCILNNLAVTDSRTTKLLNQNHVWDVIQHSLGPSLASLLSRLQQRLVREQDLGELDLQLLERLRESTVTLMSHLLTLGHYLCWNRSSKDLKLMEMHCNEVHNSLVGGNIFSIANGHEYVTALLKASCQFSQEPLVCDSSSTSESSIPTHPPQLSSTPSSPPVSLPRKTSAEITPDSSTKEGDTSDCLPQHPPRSQGIAITGARYPRRRSSLKHNSATSSGPGSYNPFGTSEGKYGSFMRSAAIFNSSPNDSPAHSWSIWNSSSLDGNSHCPPGSSLRSWFWVSKPDGSDQSGYEADGEPDKRGGTEMGESCDEVELSSQLIFPQFPACFVPTEVRQRLWTILPLYQCISLLKESINSKGSADNREKCVEVFLHQLCALLKADQYNVSLLSGKSLLETLLDTVSPLLASGSDRSTILCQLLCQISEVLCSYQISASETRKLFLKLQASKSHLENLSGLLYSIAHSASENPSPSAFVSFSYPHPTDSLDPRHFLTVPYHTSWDAKSRAISMWICVSKYPLQAWLHLFSAFTGDCFLQVWVCTITGDLIIRVCPTMELKFSLESDSPHSVVLGSVLQLDKWQHVVINVLPMPMEPVYKLLVVVDGSDTFRSSVKLPVFNSLITSTQGQYYVAGGVVSTHTRKKHLSLVQADNSALEWKLCSLSVLNGFSNPSIAGVLHCLGPDVASSNEHMVSCTIDRCHIGRQGNYQGDSSVITSVPISDEEKAKLLETPILSYSAYDPHRVFLMNYKHLREDEPSLELNQVHELQWVVTANAVTRPQLLDMIQTVVGIEQLVYLYAKIVSEGCAEEIHVRILSLLHMAVEHSVMTAVEFQQQGGMPLVQRVMRTPQAAVGERIMKTMLAWCCGPDSCQVKVLSVLREILLDWRIWHKGEEVVWEQLLGELHNLLSHDKYSSMNREQFHRAGAIKLILLTSKERALDNLPPLSPAITAQYVRLCECLLGSPPDLPCLRYISDHLLVADLNDVKFLNSPTPFDTSISAIDGRAPPNLSLSIHPLSRSSAGSEGAVAGVLGSPLSPTGSRSTLILLSGSTSVSDDEPEEVIAFNTNPVEGRLPNSSYSWEDNLFTWTDITGQSVMKDSELADEVPASLEVGLLGVVRRLITLLPDQRVKQVIGQALQHEAFIAIAYNKSIIVRTAVVRVLDEYFKRGEAMRSNFVQVKGFNLLANQLKQFKVSFELMSALGSIVVGQEINLVKRDQWSMYVQLHKVVSGFHMHAVIPLIQVLINSTSQPQLCHSTLVFLRELFESVRGMPLFMLNNGLLKVICQLICIVTDHNQLSNEDKELLLTDVLQLCKLVVIFAISAEQEESFRMMDNLLVCLRHCSELRRAKDPNVLSISYLHLYQYHILVIALRYFLEDMQGGVVSRRWTERHFSLRSVPTLSSSGQTGLSDLNNRFVTTINTAVDWSLYGIEPFTSAHAQYFNDDSEVAMETTISLDKEVLIPEMDVNFVKFLLSYCHKILQPAAGKKVGGVPLDRFSFNGRNQLKEQCSRLVHHLVSPRHDNTIRCAALRLFWSMEDSRYILEHILDSTIKRAVAYRLILMITELMKLPPPFLDRETQDTFDKIFQVVVKSGVTKLKAQLQLQSLLSYEEERDSRKKQKYTATLEDMRAYDQNYLSRMEFDTTGFAQRQINQYGRLVEKARHRQLSIDQASASVTQRIFDLQSSLKKNFLDEISLAGMHERDALQNWRRVILLNTHPRALWSGDEGRQMCWQLDPTEGPGRVRRRMMQVPRLTNERHLLPEAVASPNKYTDVSPLSFIFENTAHNAMDGLLKKFVPKDGEVVPNVPWRCSNISPDNCCQGTLVISNICCYFIGHEPLGDPNVTKLLPSDEETTLLSWEHYKIVEIHRRRYMLQNNALEIFLINGKTMLLSFDSTKDRDVVRGALLQLDLPNLVDRGEADNEKLRNITTSWRLGETTNFEYLMELNKLAGRTFNDLMQYPVFPWILADYKSRQLDTKNPMSFRKLGIPVSIQDDSKLKKYKDTYNFLEAELRSSQTTAPGLPNQTSKPYHYGSHYSNSGIVLHFLVRLPPFTDMFLAFQGRSFDIADRTFHEVGTTWWLSSSESATDVKELIPEFFFLPEFLVNRERFNFGERQNGERVDSVGLPAWANKNPRLFILKHRQALECEVVSQNLHSWIDLVFGYKQTGKAAVQAVNVFHPATYYGADGMDIEAVSDETQRAAMKAMVKTYGQMPLQLFKESHPARTKSAVLTSFRMRLGVALKRLTSNSPLLRVTSSYFWMKISVHKVKNTYSSSECDFIGGQGLPDMQMFHLGEVEYSRSPESLVYIGGGELLVIDQKVLFVQSSSPSTATLLIQWGTWDNSVIVRSTVSDTAVIRLPSHPLNNVTCCECVCNGQMIVSGGSTGIVSFWKISNTSQTLGYYGDVVHLRGHSGAVQCLAACKPFSILVTGSIDKTAIVWDTNRLSYVNSLSGHEGPVTVIATSPTLGDIATVCVCKTTKQSIKQASYCMLRLWTINGKEIERKDVEIMINTLQYTAAPEGVYVNALVGGLANGSIRFWSSWDLTSLREIHCPLAMPTPVLSLAISSDNKELHVGYSNQQITSWVKPKHDTAGAYAQDGEFEHLNAETAIYRSVR